eukprot:Phypoly_transcript_11537.p1 GENE.Phypoly_transcript_11537~~Phypoly_transcript_11537.p1  ORF type:complete len:360 (-),score=52.48 Phypoly_transcript_11537:20-1099(-)
MKALLTHLSTSSPLTKRPFRNIVLSQRTMAQTIRAALVETPGQPPVLKTTTLAEPSSSQTRVKVIAAGLHQLVRSRASGKHYSAAHAPGPIIPGVDGVGELPTGEKVFFSCFDPTSTPSFAEYANISTQDVFRLPADSTAKPEVVAALGNPVMSSYMAYKHRVPHIKPGFSVLILGVTGVSGQIAAQVSKYMGAAKIIGAGRNQAALDKLKSSGAISESITLVEDQALMKETFANAVNDVDLVIDYLWGPVAEATIAGIYSKRKEVSKRLDWVQIGHMAGATIPISAPTFRQANFVMCGSGLGSVSPEEMRKSLGELAGLIAQGKFTYPVDAQPFEKIQELWDQKEKSDSRLVFVWQNK